MLCSLLLSPHSGSLQKLWFFGSQSTEYVAMILHSFMPLSLSSPAAFSPHTASYHRLLPPPSSVITACPPSVAWIEIEERLQNKRRGHCHIQGTLKLQEMAVTRFNLLPSLLQPSLQPLPLPLPPLLRTQRNEQQTGLAWCWIDRTQSCPQPVKVVVPLGWLCTQ